MAVVDVRLLEKAAAPGRIRGIALDLWAAIAADPRHAGSLLRTGLREARALHSRERRFVADTLFDLIRHRARLDGATGNADPLHRWLRWLVVLGLDPERAREQASTLQIRPLPEADDPIENIALHGSIPRDAAASLYQVYGDQSLAFLAACNQRAPIWLRTNARLTTREALLRRLGDEGIAGVAGERSGLSIRVEGRPNLAGSRAFRDGLFEVQDEGSLVVAERVPAAGLVVDYCAGAGGKSLALAANRGVRVIACDVRKAALQELGKRAKRAQVSVEVRVLPDDLAGVQADAVLVDAPCSGIGVLRRHPENRWRLDELGSLPARQGEILARAAKLVKPGGTLVYATCSVLPSENEDVVQAFLADRPDFARAGDWLRVAPHTHDTDGFTAATLVRSATLTR